MYKRNTKFKAPRPGAFIGVPFERYAAHKALNNSKLKKILTSPAHFKFQYPDTPTLSFGRLYHELTLTPRQFDRNWAIYEGKTRRGKEWENFKLTAGDKDICTAKERDDAQLIADSVRRTAIGKEYIRGKGHNEVTLIWEEDIDGEPLMLKCRLDRVVIGNTGETHALVDLKGTTADTKESFAREAARYHYEMQAAFYLRGWEAVTGESLANHEFIFVAVEKATRIVSAYWLPADALHVGRQKVDAALKRFVECKRANRWPAPNHGRAEELTNYFPRDFEGCMVEMGAMPESVAELEDIAA